MNKKEPLSFKDNKPVSPNSFQTFTSMTISTQFQLKFISIQHEFLDIKKEAKSHDIHGIAHARDNFTKHEVEMIINRKICQYLYCLYDKPCLPNPILFIITYRSHK